MKFEYYLDAAREWRWRLKADNGETITEASESYVRKEDCLRGIELTQLSAAAAIVQVKG
jgi:uncharacterized protein YegP (UPF0339 family)